MKLSLTFKGEWPFPCGHYFFDIYLLPLLDDIDLFRLAGVCTALRKHIIEDLSDYWFGRYLEIYQRGVPEKVVRVGRCKLSCIDSWDHRSLKKIGFWDPDDPFDQDTLIPIKKYHKIPLWNDEELPPEAYETIQRGYGRSWKGRDLCKYHHKMKYFDIHHKKHKSMRRKTMNYYQKVLFFDVFQISPKNLKERCGWAKYRLAEKEAEVAHFQKKVRRFELMDQIRQNIANPKKKT